MIPTKVIQNSCLVQQYVHKSSISTAKFVELKTMDNYVHTITQFPDVGLLLQGVVLEFLICFLAIVGNWKWRLLLLWSNFSNGSLVLQHMFYYLVLNKNATRWRTIFNPFLVLLNLLKTKRRRGPFCRNALWLNLKYVSNCILFMKNCQRR